MIGDCLRRATKSKGRLFGVLLLMMLGLTIAVNNHACIDSLPEAARCPPEAALSFCQPLQVDPAAPERCRIFENECLRGQRGDCKCTPATECPLPQRGPSGSTCFPPPDCPPSVKSAAPGAQCVELVPTTTASDAGPARTDCTCGCASCAIACDGRGMVIAGDQEVRLEFANASNTSSTDIAGPTGTIGALLRVRGQGLVEVNALLADGTIGTLIANASINSETFQDVPSQTFLWNEAGRKPNGIEIRTVPGAHVEVDCLIPWLKR